MKRVYVLRHGEWKSPEDKLTKVGKQKALELKEHLPDFEFVYSSDFGRTKDTAEILSNKTPKIDNRAGVLDASRDQLDMIKNLRESHPLGVAGAIFEIEELREPLKKAGRNLLELIKETLERMKNGQNALVVSHDGTMVSLEKIIYNESFDYLNKTYQSLGGLILDENLKFSKIK